MPGRPGSVISRSGCCRPPRPLLSNGYDAMNLKRVAAEAKAHRSDVYRRRPSRARLVTDVLAEHLPPV